MTPTEIFITGLIRDGIKSNKTYLELRDSCLNLTDNYHKKYRMKKKIDSIYERFIQESKEDNTIQEINKKQNKDRHITMRIEKSLFNSIELASKQSNLKVSQYIHKVLEKAIEQSIN